VDFMTHHWFLPHTPDLIGLLGAQADVTIQGMDAFAAWSGGETAKAEELRAAEHAADDARRTVQKELRAAFSTPLDPEDIYELSEGLDAVLNAAKNAVREAEVMALTPDDALSEMALLATAGVRHVCNAFGVLTKDGDKATAEADAAIKCERDMERLYRMAMSKLLEVDDVGRVTAWREMYRRYARLGEALVQVAERVWYAVVKEA
jgi:uncharacterized protein Yka (UPF0111/DUF47 family)